MHCSALVRPGAFESRRAANARRPGADDGHEGGAARAVPPRAPGQGGPVRVRAPHGRGGHAAPRRAGAVGPRERRTRLFLRTTAHCLFVCARSFFIIPVANQSHKEHAHAHPKSTHTRHACTQVTSTPQTGRERPRTPTTDSSFARQNVNAGMRRSRRISSDFLRVTLRHCDLHLHLPRSPGG